jgi:hypothetical protein
MKILSVQPLGSQIYAVTDSSPSKATVDLKAHGWNGSCNCPAFTECCAVLLSATKKRWRCDHINAVRQWVMENEFPSLVEQAEKIITLTDYANADSYDHGS